MPENPPPETKVKSKEAALAISAGAAAIAGYMTGFDVAAAKESVDLGLVCSIYSLPIAALATHISCINWRYFHQVREQEALNPTAN